MKREANRWQLIPVGETRCKVICEADFKIAWYMTPLYYPIKSKLKGSLEKFQDDIESESKKTRQDDIERQDDIAEESKKTEEASKKTRKDDIGCQDESGRNTEDDSDWGFGHHHGRAGAAGELHESQDDIEVESLRGVIERQDDIEEESKKTRMKSPSNAS